MALSEREVSSHARNSASMFPLALRPGAPRFSSGVSIAPKLVGRTRMTWKTPKIVEVPVGMEINMYACAARK